MCYITATELKQNLSHYMMLSQTEDVYVMKNNKVVTVLTSPTARGIKELRSLRGFIPLDNPNISDDELLAEAILEHENPR